MRHPVPEPSPALLRDLDGFEAMKRYQRWRRDLFAPLLGPRVLEVGCGTGLMLEQFADRDLVVGIDHQPGCVAQARARLSGRDNVEILLLDAQDPATRALATRGFTSAIFANSLETMEDDALALGNAAAVLEPGGRLAVLAWALETPPPALHASCARRGYPPRRLGALLAAAGCHDVTVRWVNLLGIPGWWLDRRRHAHRQLRRIDFVCRDFAVPMMRMVDRLTGPPRGRLVLGVGVR